MTAPLAARQLWTPSAEFARGSVRARSMEWLAQERGGAVSDSDALWCWSIDDAPAFRGSPSHVFDVRARRLAARRRA